MPHRIIAILNDDDLGLEAEVEVEGVTEEQMKVLVRDGYARYYNDTKPMVGKSVNEYEPGMEYPRGRQIFHNDGIVICDVPKGQKSSTTWVQSEWRTVVHGANEQ